MWDRSLEVPLKGEVWVYKKTNSHYNAAAVLCQLKLKTEWSHDHWLLSSLSSKSGEQWLPVTTLHSAPPVFCLCKGVNMWVPFFFLTWNFRGYTVGFLLYSLHVNYIQEHHFDTVGRERSIITAGVFCGYHMSAVKPSRFRDLNIWQAAIGFEGGRALDLFTWEKAHFFFLFWDCI